LVKTGLLRVLHVHHTGNKGLMRLHADQLVTDIQFFNQDDVFASVGGPTAKGLNRSSLVVTRVSLQPGTGEISLECLLEFRTEHFSISRLVWHPFDMNVRTYCRSVV
jgi:hypothetical protein